MGHPSSPVPFLERQEIEQKAADFTRPLWGGNWHSDAFDIARRLAIRVTLVNFGESDVAGKLVREGDTAEIVVRDDDPYTRQNFTVAHELGHLALGHPGTWEDTTNTLYRRSAWRADAAERRAEYQANLFAAALLMPESVIREKWHLLRSVHFLAPYFRVSKKALQFRLEGLGLIVPTPKGVHFLDLSGWEARSAVPDLPTLSDEAGPIPRFPPIATDEMGRIIPMSDEEREARTAALSRVLRIAGSRVDEAQEEGEDAGKSGVTPEGTDSSEGSGRLSRNFGEETHHEVSTWGENVFSAAAQLIPVRTSGRAG